MKKLLTGLMVIAFAGASFAGSHGGAMKDDKKMEEMKAACKKADPKMDDKMKMECKKMEEMKAACMKADPKMDDKMKMECKKMMEEKKPMEEKKKP